MPERISELKKPRGMARLALRLPIWFYRLKIGWLLGTRFVLLTHTGRKSGLPHRTVLEVVRYDKTNGACIVASGWGSKSDWYYNVTADPKIIFQVRNKSLAGVADRLSSEQAGEELVNYAHRHPLAFAELGRFMGIRMDGSDADIQATGNLIPLFAFKPASKPKG